MKSFLLWSLIVSLYLFTGCNIENDSPKHPNIVFILADDLGYGDLTCYNPQSLIPTPRLDQLASEGMRFTDAHSSSAVCTPSRYSILTGRYAWRTHLKRSVLWAWDPPLIKRERLTLPEMLKEKDYQTAAIGKWHLGWVWPTHDSLTAKEANGLNVDYTQPITGGPLEHGFDYYFGDDVPNFPPYTFIENDRISIEPTIMKPDSLFGGKGMMAEGWSLEEVIPEIKNKAVSYIKELSQEDQSFFLYVPLTAPHTPIAPKDEFKGQSKAGLYGDFVHEVDWVVGEIMDALHNQGLTENTLVIFTSDNGSPGRDGTNWSGKVGSVKAFGHLPNANLRGYKADIWEAGHRVPFIVRWPEKMKAGIINPELICNVDMMRTIASIVGYELTDDAGEDSYDLLPSFLGKNREPIREDLVHHSHHGNFAIRKGDWKLIFTNKAGGFSDNLNPDGYGITSPGQLYDLSSDLEEQKNLYNEMPEKVEELRLLMKKYLEEGRSTPGLIQENFPMSKDWKEIELIQN